MKVDRSALENVAHLARLKVEPDEEQQLIKDLSEIMDWVDKLKEVNTDGVEPITHMTEEINVLRKDEAIETLTQGDALKNAPEQDQKFFKVPKVMKRND